MSGIRNITKILLVALVVILITCAVSCDNVQKDHDGLNIVVTIFPEYDWVMQILGERAEDSEITLLLRNGTDIRNYQPSVADLVTISECDLFIYVGGNSESWVEDALKNAANDEMTVINLTEVLADRVVEEEIADGMEHDHEHSEDDHGQAVDEHVWLSLENARKCCEYIANRLSEIDHDNADEYTENAARYCEQLSVLDGEYKTAIESAKFSTLIFADRFPFRYLVDDYSLEYYAAFSGCSTETEASFETIAFLVDKLEASGVGSLFVIDGSDGKLARTVIENSSAKKVEVRTLNSMQSVTASDIENGITYLSVMKENLEVLKIALN